MSMENEKKRIYTHLRAPFKEVSICAVDCTTYNTMYYGIYINIVELKLRPKVMVLILERPISLVHWRSKSMV